MSTSERGAGTSPPQPPKIPPTTILKLNTGHLAGENFAGLEITRDAKGFFEPDAFSERVGNRLRTGRGTIAFIEIQYPHFVQGNDLHGSGETFKQVYTEIAGLISNEIGDRDIFSFREGRFSLLFGHTQSIHKSLRRISRLIAKSNNVFFRPSEESLHLTPAIGYVELRQASTEIELQQMAESALNCAKSSLEIEPYRYVRAKHLRGGRRLSISPVRLWNGVPRSLALLIQFILSSILGLGAPFFIYAACDALGFDISGPVYIGVVIVLMITAAMIWTEGLLALKATTPPKLIGKPFPSATVIIPAYLPNEAATIVETLTAFLKLDYPKLVQVIVAYNTPTRLPVEDELDAIASSQAFNGRFLIEPVRVIGSTSKAQNVNAVIGRVVGDFVGIFDADHHPRPDSLQRAWRWLSNGWDIVQGRCAIRNGKDSWVARMVAIEFEQIYSVSHPGRARLHGFGIFGGSNGFWRTSVLHETRMRQAMLTEDIDSSIRAVNEGHKIASDRHLISDELAPTSLNQLLNQRLRWAQGWFQVSLRRIVPALLSPRVSVRQKLGMIHLLVWRELFPWYSIQVLPILIYWVWAYGWHYIHWAVPIFVVTTIFTFSTGPLQIFLAYVLAEKPLRHKKVWFVEYFFVSTFFYSPFKDAISRIAHIKEAMRERAWRVTPRVGTPAGSGSKRVFAGATLVALMFLVGSTSTGKADDTSKSEGSKSFLSLLLGGEVSTINSARRAAAEGRNAEAAKLFAQAIAAVPSRRGELLQEYADSLSYAGRSAYAVPLYRELLKSPDLELANRSTITAHLASALTWSSQFEAALKVYDDLTSQAPKDTDFAVHRARVLVSLGRYVEAIAALDRVSADRWASGVNGAIGDEILVLSARNAAKTDQNELAALLFDRAIRHNLALRPILLREYADQLTFSDRSADAIPLYREVIAAERTSLADRTAADVALGQALLQTKQPKDAYKSFSAALADSAPGTDAYVSAQRGLSLSLTWSGAPRKALGAWKSYLKELPKDTDAIIHQAQVLSTLHDTEEALKSYKAAYAVDHTNAAARRGIVDETINEARIDARQNRNTDAADLFASAITLDSQKRLDLLREYADQLSFSNRAGDAVPLYREVLAQSSLPVVDRKRAMKGLADALAWAGEPDQALIAYTQLVTAYPDDDSLRWAKLVFAARQDAKADKNSNSADLFAQAIAISSISNAGILREYADQLSFAGHSDQAIPAYLQFLSQSDISDPDRLSAQTGLARAYDWSGHQDEAKAIYNELAAKYPDDFSYQWDLLVVSAHEAAQLDQNEAAAIQFAKAIRLLPDRRETLLKEYADQLSFAGQSARAIPFYREVIAQPNLSDINRFSAEKGLAQAYDWSNRPDQAKTIFTSLSNQHPGDVSLQWGVLVFSAHIAAMQDRNKEAAELLAQAIQLMPARRAVILKEYADKLAFSGNMKDAIPIYKELIAQGGKSSEVRVQHLALALALAWDNQSDSALSEYQKLLSASPNDVEARDGLAQTLSWMGRQTDAEAAYQVVLNQSPKDPEAQRGLAQVEDWQGHHRAAQELLAERIADDPSDLEARRLLAQSLVWAGRPDEALKELRLAMGSVQVSGSVIHTRPAGPKYEPAVLGTPDPREQRQLQPGLRSINDRPDN